MNAVKEAQWPIVDKNRRKQDEEKHNTVRANSVKMEARIIKHGSSYDNILSSVENLLSVTKTTEDSTDSIIQAIIPLYYDTLKDDFIHMGVNIGDFTDLKKQMSMLDITRRWFKDIIW